MSSTKDDSIALIVPSRADRIENSPEIRGDGTPAVVQRVPIAKLQEELNKLRVVVTGAGFDQPSRSGFVVDEITITAEVSASGEIGFLVAGAEASATGSIEIKFRRASGKD